MSTFLDLRTSQGNGIGTLSNNSASPSFLGSIGLIVGSVGNIRVDLNATLSVIANSATTVTIQIARNLPGAAIGVFIPANVIYTTTHEIANNTDQTIGVNVGDYHPSASLTEPGQINYSLFAYSTAVDTSIAGRPQTLNGVAAAG
jgi:hypothetical protein